MIINILLDMSGEMAGRMRLRAAFEMAAMRRGSRVLVTAQVPPERSGYAESADQRLRVLDQSVNDVPALLPGRRDEGADHGEVASPFLRPEAAGDFLPDLHHAPVALGLIVGCALERCTRSPGAIPGRQTLAP